MSARDQHLAATPRGLAQAIVDTVQALADRKDDVPSHDVQLAAAGMYGHRIERETMPTDVYYIDGDHGHYVVVLKMESINRDADIIDATCTCPAIGTCKHKLRVLAQARLHGHQLTVPTLKEG